MIGSSIAIRYSAQRPQFGDKLIMDYLSHQRRLLPGLAATYAMHLGLKQLKVGGGLRVSRFECGLRPANVCKVRVIECT
jgi:hypothetical protein